MRPILLNWPVSTVHGWGILGLNIFWQWAKDGDVRALMGAPIAQNDVAGYDPLRVYAASDAIVASNQFQRELANPSGKTLGFPVVHGLGNGLVGPKTVRGTRNIGRCIFEDTKVSDLDAKLAEFDVLLTASHWNADLLRAHCAKKVEIIFEGIDPSLFHPAPKAGLLDPNRFYIFSGGKVEFRKGHDLVLLAFREFSRRRKEAVLVTCWHSPWPQMAAGFHGRLEHPLELSRDGRIDVAKWAARNGIDPQCVIDLPQTPNPIMPSVLREMDCAIAVSRAEACTNLPATEAMACGIPVILAPNTGVLDLARKDNCLYLTRQSPVTGVADAGTDGWGESAVEEIVEALERLYTDRALARQIGLRGAEWIIRENRTWSAHAAKLKTLILSL